MPSSDSFSCYSDVIDHEKTIFLLVLNTYNRDRNTVRSWDVQKIEHISPISSCSETKSKLEPVHVSRLKKKQKYMIYEMYAKSIHF